MDNTSNVVERLRAMYSHREDGIPTQLINPDGLEAADTIERLRAELALHNCGDPACACIKDTRLGRERAMDELIAMSADEYTIAGERDGRD